MKVVYKVKNISTLTYMKVYDVVIRYKIGDSGYVIIDDFENQQRYYHGYFMHLEEGRDFKINTILNS
jgi:ribonuclease HIII